MVPRIPNKSKPASPLGVLNPWIEHAVKQSRKQVSAIVAHCRDAIGNSSSQPEAVAGLIRCIKTLPSFNFAGVIGDYMVAAAFAGAYAAQRRIEQRGAKAASSKWLAEEVNLDAFDRPFRQAIDALKNRVALKPDDFLRLETDARSRAGRIAGMFDLRVVEDVYAAIVKTLGEGGTAHDFRDAVRAIPEAAGWVGEDSWHANMVFGQNAAMAFNAGNYVASANAGIEHWQFRTYLDVDDENPCPICRPMDGLIFAMSDRTFYPPVHINCRCYANPVFEGEVPDGGPMSSADVDNPEYEKSQSRPSAFRFDPAHFAKLDAFDLSAVPDDIRGAFAAFAADRGWTTTG